VYFVLCDTSVGLCEHLEVTVAVLDFIRLRDSVSIKTEKSVNDCFLCVHAVMAKALCFVVVNADSDGENVVLRLRWLKLR